MKWNQEIEEVIEYVSRIVGVMPKAMYGKNRDQKVVEARYIAVLIMKEELGMKLKDIAKVFGKSNHTWALYAYRKINDLGEVYKSYREKIKIYKSGYQKQRYMISKEVAINFSEEMLEAILGGLAQWYKQNREEQEEREKISKQIEDVIKQIQQQGIDIKKYQTYIDLIN